MANRGKKKKANGEGSIYQRKTSDGRWVGQYTNEQGKTQCVYGKTQKEVRISSPRPWRTVTVASASMRVSSPSGSTWFAGLRSP